MFRSSHPGSVSRNSRRTSSLSEEYPASPPCSCQVCTAYCARPGWWTVEEAGRAIDAGYAHRMMLEVAPELTFAIVSPAFKGAEGRFALNEYALNGCTFLIDGRCELHGTGHQPLECRFCHHDRPGQGPRCHGDVEADWRTSKGRLVVARWTKLIRG